MLIAAEVLHPFNLFQLYAVALWALDNYEYYAACILLIQIFSSGFNILLPLAQTKDGLSCAGQQLIEGLWGLCFGVMFWNKRTGTLFHHAWPQHELA